MNKRMDLDFNGNARRIQVGLSWEPNETMSVYDKMPKAHDLDLTCVMIGAGKSIYDILTPPYPQRDKYGFCAFHSGDNTSGGSDYEDEYVRVNLDKMPAEIEALAFVVSTKNGLKFSEANMPVCEFMDEMSGGSFYKIDLKTLGLKSQDRDNEFALLGVIGRPVAEGGLWSLAYDVIQIADIGRQTLEKIVQDVL